MVITIKPTGIREKYMGWIVESKEKINCIYCKKEIKENQLVYICSLNKASIICSDCVKDGKFCDTSIARYRKKTEHADKPATVKHIR